MTRNLVGAISWLAEMRKERYAAAVCDNANVKMGTVCLKWVGICATSRSYTVGSRRLRSDKNGQLEVLQREMALYIYFEGP